MFLQAFLVALSYWIAWMIDSVLSFQTTTRPIIMGTITGLLCGDIVTGVIMGASLEAVYMGISGIGGVVAADYRSATAIGVGLTIISGISIEEGIAIAVPIGAILISLMPLTVAFSNVLEPLYLKLAKAGDSKKYNLLMWAQLFIQQHLLDTLAIFLACYFGATAVSAAFAVIPAWLLHGLNVSGGMLVVVGLGLTTQAIYNQSTPFFVLFGFVLSKYLNMPVLAIAIVGVVIAYILYDRNYRIQKVTQESEGDIF